MHEMVAIAMGADDPFPHPPFPCVIRYKQS